MTFQEKRNFFSANFFVAGSECPSRRRRITKQFRGNIFAKLLLDIPFADQLSISKQLNVLHLFHNGLYLI